MPVAANPIFCPASDYAQKGVNRLSRVWLAVLNAYDRMMAMTGSKRRQRDVVVIELIILLIPVLTWATSLTADVGMYTSHFAHFYLRFAFIVISKLIDYYFNTTCAINLPSLHLISSVSAITTPNRQHKNIYKI